MSIGPAVDPVRAAEIADLYDARIGAELAAATAALPGSGQVPFGGSPYAQVLLVKGMPGPAEESGGPALSGKDGDAASAALAALGLGGEYFAVVSRPTTSADAEAVRRRLRAVIEAVDPEYVVGLDAVAAEDLAATLGLDSAPGFGRAVRVLGRTFVAVAGLEESLTEPSKKRRVWGQLKALVPRAPLW